MDTGKLEKLTIRSYKDVEKPNSGTPDSTYTTAINPESIKLNFSHEFNTEQAPGTTATASSYIKSKPQSLSVAFLFDGTGVIPDAKYTSDTPSFSNGEVQDQIDEFKKAVYDYSGDDHKPYNVQIIWGHIKFKGFLETVDFDYKLFNRDGKPLRVIATAKFIGALDEEYRAALEKKASPDLTHIRQVVEGNTLPLMCNEIYGDSKYYLEVAKINGITNFRKLTPGQRINFPPIEKVAK